MKITQPVLPPFSLPFSPLVPPFSSRPRHHFGATMMSPHALAPCAPDCSLYKPTPHSLPGLPAAAASLLAGALLPCCASNAFGCCCPPAAKALYRPCNYACSLPNTAANCTLQAVQRLPTPARPNTAGVQQPARSYKCLGSSHPARLWLVCSYKESGVRNKIGVGRMCWYKGRRPGRVGIGGGYTRQRGESNGKQQPSPLERSPRFWRAARRGVEHAGRRAATEAAWVDRQQDSHKYKLPRLPRRSRACQQRQDGCTTAAPVQRASVPPGGLPIRQRRQLEDGDHRTHAHQPHHRRLQAAVVAFLRAGRRRAEGAGAG